jgi:formylglycine-generating enzyme required for sulfatase activity
MSKRFLSVRGCRGLAVLACVAGIGMLAWPSGGLVKEAVAREGGIKDTLNARSNVIMKMYAQMPLKQGSDNPGTWVDAERWCVAHAALDTGLKLEEANEYLAKVGWVSLNRGLVADTDIQVTDLLRTYLRFKTNPRLKPEASEHLLKMFKDWKVPNIDRNRDADVRYEWPYFYTENHSLNILVASHLIDEAVFPTAPIRGKKGTAALDEFLTDRLRFGWSEFHSPQYGLVTAKALTLLVDFSPKEEIKSKARALLDVLTLEYAQQAIHPYRGVPFVRGSQMRLSNKNNSMIEASRFWFGEPAGTEQVVAPPPLPGIAAAPAPGAAPFAPPKGAGPGTSSGPISLTAPPTPAPAPAPVPAPAPAAKLPPGVGGATPSLPQAGKLLPAPPFNDPHLVHLLDSDYRPPLLADRMIQTRSRVPAYTVRQTMVTGRPRLRVPLVIRVVPGGTLASATGAGHFYDGGFWMVGSSASPDNVITGTYGNNDRNLFQVNNALMTFGTIEVKGGFKPTKFENVTIYSDGTTRVGVIALAAGANLVVIDESGGVKSVDRFAAEVASYEPTFEPETGKFSFGLPDKARYDVANQRVGDLYRLQRVTINGELFALDNNMLMDSDEMRSELGSGWYQARCFGQVWEYKLPSQKQPLSWDWARPLAARTSNSVGMIMVQIPQGEFPMGSPVTEGRGDEQPVRWATTPTYYMGMHEVTVGQWKLYQKAGAGAPAMPEWYDREVARTEMYPITYITREEAQGFCDWLTKIEGVKYRLPTEVEWEKAARGWNYQVYPWGNRYDRSQAGTPNMTYAPIMTRPGDVSPFGCMDMAGNVWEWCSDNYSYFEKDGMTAGMPLPGFTKVEIPAKSPVVRGCGWNFDPETFRCAYRTSMPEGARSLHVGFRVVCDPAAGAK